MARPADPHARDALMAAARAEFARRGLRGARVEDITVACGLSKGAFYLHFPSKESLFGALVGDFNGEINACFETRAREISAFTTAHGRLGPDDVARRTPRYRKLLEIEEAADLRSLEVIWRFRDVVDVLMTGCQGTQFEGMVWEMAEREVQRVAGEFSGEQQKRACRDDVPGELFGTLIVGTYLLLAKRMSRLPEKPDLAGWATSIQALVREGSAPARPLHLAPKAAETRRAVSGPQTGRKTRRSTAAALRTPSTRSTP